jgi:Ca2+-binding EF-hand superfamily protein
MKTTIALLCTLALALPCIKGQDKAAKKAAKAGIDMEAIFKKIDGNSDGKLSKDEFAKLENEIRAKGDKAVKIADRIKASANDLFVKLDANKDGSLTLDEAKKFDINMLGGAKAAVKDLDATFKKLDANGDKKLSKDEFEKIAEQLAAAKPDKAAKRTEKLKGLVGDVFAKLDENKDNNLSSDEFKKFTGLKGKKPK